MKWWDRITVLWMLSFEPTFLLSSFTFIKKLFSFYSLSGVTIWRLHLESLSGSLWRRCGSVVACCRVGGMDCIAVHAWDLLKEVAIIFITSTIDRSQVNSREGTQPQPSTENWIKNLLSMALPIRRPSFPLSQSIPSESFHKPLILFHQRADDWKPQSQNFFLNLDLMAF